MSENKRKLKYLAKNTGILTIAQLSSKVLTFLLVPLYTNVLTTEEYGINDLLVTTVTLLIPFLTLNIVDATLRFAIDKENNRKDVFTVSLKYIGIGSVIICIITALNGFLGLFPFINAYWSYFILIFILTSLSNMMAAFSRGIDKVTDLAISGAISSFVLVASNLVLLLFFQLGLEGYFISHCLGPAAQIIYLSIRLQIWRYVSLETDGFLQRKMLIYARPLIANQVAWWINSASDRYVVTWICGFAVNGIYSVGYKIPTILAVFINIFNQAWTLSAVQDFDPEDKDGFFSNTYSLYNFAVTCLCSLMIIFTRVLARLLYAKDFYDAWIFVPFLLNAFVFSSLSGYLGGVFSAVKDSSAFAKSTVVGAAANVVLNLLLVPILGAIGAAIATIICYFLIWLLRLIGSKRYIKIRFDLKRDSIGYLLLLLQIGVLFRIKIDSIVYYTIQIILFVLLLLLFNREFKRILETIKKS